MQDPAGWIGHDDSHRELVHQRVEEQALVFGGRARACFGQVDPPNGAKEAASSENREQDGGQGGAAHDDACSSLFA